MQKTHRSSSTSRELVIRNIKNKQKTFDDVQNASPEERLIESYALLKQTGNRVLVENR